ncbi:MAG: peroxiredoxin family protein [Desulfovibrionaceae bacterium]
MRTIILFTLTGLMLLAASAFAGHALDAPPVIAPKPGDILADMALQGAMTPEQARYLGLSQDAAPPTLADIKADYLLVEFFSMYCPYCQHEAPHVNDLFALVSKSPEADTVKMLGIGIGNSPFEVDYFREKFTIPMPLFTDEDYAVHKRVGEVGTPFFLLLKRVGNGATWEVAHTQEGPFDAMPAFHQTILHAAGLK